MSSIDDRLAEIEARNAGRMPASVDNLYDDVTWLISQLREHRRLQTLVECSKCGMGFRAREMGQVGGKRLCAGCLADALRGSHVLVKVAQEERERLRSLMSEIVMDAEGYEINGGDDHFVSSVLIERAKTALNGDGDE